MKLAELKAAIHAKHPTMPMLLQDIHRALKAQPDQVILLKEEEISTIHDVLELQTQTSLGSKLVKQATKAGRTTGLLARLKNMKLDNI
jgi:DNA polymerase III psi subunit